MLFPTIGSTERHHDLRCFALRNVRIVVSAVTYKAANRLRRSPHPAAKHRSDEVEAKPSRAAVWKASRENIQRFLAGAKVPSREELAAYWTRVADHALRYIGRRPLTLVRPASAAKPIVRFVMNLC